MDFKNKYFKYKNKYLQLRNLYGGNYTCKIYIVSTYLDKKQELLRNLTAKLIYPNYELQTNENMNIYNINTEANRLYNNAKRFNIFNESELVQLYDNIGSIYICSRLISELWNELSNKLELNIAIYNGDNSSFKSLNDENFIIGINILAGCSTKVLAESLNKKKLHGKYFIGIDGYKHNYGKSFYLCGENVFKMNADEFIYEYEKYGYELPLIKIIKIFFDKFKNCEYPNCRSCSILTLEKIEQKLQVVKDHIIKTKILSGKDDYFNSNYQEKCNSNSCKIDNEFELYFKEKLVVMLNEEKKANEKREADMKSISDKLLSIPDGTDITDQYKDFIKETDFINFDNIAEKGFSLSLENNYLKIKFINFEEKNLENVYKIYLKKESNDFNYLNIYKLNEYGKLDNLGFYNFELAMLEDESYKE
jgi:hypothetical protein